MTLTLSGDWQNAAEMTLTLLKHGFKLEFAPVSAIESQPHLIALASLEDLPATGRGWYGWLRVDDPALTLAAYQAGARTVFPPDIPPALLAQALPGADVSGASSSANERLSNQRSLRRGEPVFLEPDSVLTIHQGVLATMMVHGDGVEVLLGLTGAGQILVAHPEDECFIQVLAHTPATISIQSWEQAVVQPGFSEKMRLRLQRMEAWAAMQARPYLDQRLLGVFSLLAEQFGVPHPEGTLIDVRLTHLQLAAAVGATRTTITRVLGELRTTGKLSAEGAGRGERFVLRQNARFCHH